LNDQIGFRCLHETCREFYPLHSSTGIMLFGPLQHNQSLKHCSFVILWGQTDISIFMVSFFQDPSLICPWLLHKRYIYLSLSFLQPLRSSQIHFCSSSSFQIIAHIWNCQGKPASLTSGSVLSMIKVVFDRDLFIKVEYLSSRFAWS